ncbi:cytochrome P450 [Actinokineospora inagensis]|uniref:cytochrome P450 n=1 Tax=Actinokineospora inagensis TaxID=103730 RepID=UPI00047B6786|nr:cytochrome P450 [Actinokineospora inagensis]
MVVRGRAGGALPLVGHAHRFLVDPFRFLRSLPARGDIVDLRLGPQRVVMVCEPALVRQLLVDDRVYDKGGPFFDQLNAVLGEGMVNCPHSAHRRQRRMAQPAFRRDRLPGYAEVALDRAVALAGSWRSGQVVTVFDGLFALMAEVATETMFGGLLTAADRAAVGADSRMMMDALLVRMFTPPGLRRLLPGARRFDRASVRLRRRAVELVAAYRASGVDHGDLMSVLVAGEDWGSDEELVDQVVTFYVAATETTASVLTSVLHVLAHNPSVQGRVRAEVLANGPATVDSLDRLTYTANVVSEVLRLYWPGLLLTREVTEDTELGGHPLPRGTCVAYSPYVLHTRADLFPSPDSFDPDRWAGDHGRPQDRFVPFGAGARMCIGDRLARIEAVAVLAAVVSRWDVHPVTGPAFRPSHGITPHRRGLRVRVTAR